MEYIVRHCPKCSKEFPVPNNLTSCICMYCGESISFSEEAVYTLAYPEEDILKDYDKAISELGLLIKDREKIMPQFTNGMYATSFSEYLKTGETILRPIERYASVSQERSETAVDRAAQELLSLIGKEIKETKLVLTGPTKGRIVEEYRLFLTVYLVPMIRYLKLSVSEPLSDAIITLWRNSYPKFQFNKGTYEDLESGFKQKLCFITTAVCKTMNKPDDCYELTAFRSFRDNYMSGTREGQQLIEEYYKIAPAIVAYLNLCTDYQFRYQQLWMEYLQPCLKAIEEKRYSECEKYYKKMVYDLKEEIPY